MITENEKKALQLAKKVFEHFTHDALPIAREIIVMEHELEQPQVNGKPSRRVSQAIPEIKNMDGQLNNESVNGFPVSDISVIGLVDDVPEQPDTYPKEELVNQSEDQLPF
jgi:hypothetical protein